MKHWASRGIAAWLLWPASIVFRVVVALRRLLYRLRIYKSEHPGIPVIVVGNITVGGSGKTPLVIWIAEHLKKLDLADSNGALHRYRTLKQGDSVLSFYAVVE